MSAEGYTGTVPGGGGGGGGAVDSVNGRTGAVTLTKSDVALGNVDNTSDASKPVSTATTTALALKAPIASPTFTGTVSGVTAAMVGLGSVNNTADSAKPVSTAQQAALDAKLAGPASSVSGNLVAYSGATGKVAADSGLSATTLAAQITDLYAVKADASTVTSALALKAPLASPTFTGTVGGITKAMVGLGNVDNTADSAKSFAETQVVNLTTDLAAKQPVATLTTKGDLYVATAASTVTRLPVGSNTFVLTADSTQTAGMKWAAAGGGGGTATTFARAYLTPGDITPGVTASFTPVAGVTLALAAAAGDNVEIKLNGLLNQTAADFFEIVILVGGAIVRYGSTGTSSPTAAGEGDPAIYPLASSVIRSAAATYSLAVVSGDLSGGNVTFGLAFKGSGSGKVFASANYPFRMHARNDHQ